MINTIVFSGGTVEDREKYSLIAIEKGYRVSSSVSKKTDAVVSFDGSDNAKIRRAKELNISIISLEDFMTL